MVQLLSLVILITAFVESGFTFHLSKRDVVSIQALESDIANIATQTVALGNAVNAVTSGSTLVDALVSSCSILSPARGNDDGIFKAIHNDIGTLSTTINSATTDAQAIEPIPIDESSAETILSEVETFASDIITTLNDFGNQAPIFDDLPSGGFPALIKSDLSTLKSSTSAFGAELVAIFLVRVFFIYILIII